MSDVIKGFVTIDSLIDNKPGTVSALGELSAWSRTYSKEKGEYQDNNTSGYKLVAFKSNNATGEPVVVGQGQVALILAVVRCAVDYAKSHIRPYDSVDFKNTVLAEFYGRLTSFEMGGFIDNGALALPQWISWTSVDEGNNFVKVWLSDKAFQDQYDDYEIEVIEPLDQIDGFFNAYNYVLTDLGKTTLSQLGDKIQASKTVYPETYIRILEFDFYNSLNKEQVNKAHWVVLIHGKNGDNIDSIKTAIIEKIMAKTKKSRSEWEGILPDLFKRTEFFILPRWDKVSVPNLTGMSDLYSVMVNPQECVSFATSVLVDYSSDFIKNNTILLPYDYKQLMLVVVCGSNNVASKNSLVEIYPDYLPISSTLIDFNRMSQATQKWVLFIEELLIAAESADQFSGISDAIKKQYRNGELYLSGMCDGINYLVAAKSNTFYKK